MICPPEIGVETAEEDSRAHAISAIKHLAGEDKTTKQKDAQNKKQSDGQILKEPLPFL